MQLEQYDYGRQGATNLAFESKGWLQVVQNPQRRIEAGRLRRPDVEQISGQG